MIEVKLNLPTPPEGYEYTGEFRPVKAGELFLDYNSSLCTAQQDSPSYAYPLPILSKKRWRSCYEGVYYSAGGTGEVERWTERGRFSDDHHYNLGNYFQTEAEAKIMAQKVKQLFKENL